MKYLKPYEDIPQQLQRLQNRDMEIGDIELSTHSLNTIGYYRLSAYWYPMRIPIRNEKNRIIGRADNFEQGTTLQNCVEHYLFDKKLKLLIWDAIERIEIDLRTKLTLLLGQYGAFAHRDLNIFDPKFNKNTIRNSSNITQYQDYINSLDKCENRSKSKEEFSKHFFGKYTEEDNLPIWISTEIWEFSIISRLYDGLKTQHRFAIANQYGLVDPKIMRSWLLSLNFLRNTCAHHSRLWNRKIPQMPKIPNTPKFSHFAHIINEPNARERLYAVLLVLNHLTRHNTPNTQWHRRVVDLMQRFPASRYTSLKSMGFPNDWDKQKIWQ